MARALQGGGVTRTGIALTNSGVPRSLVLASTSPRRRQLLAEYGYNPEVLPARIEESAAAWLTVVELVLLNARRKSASLWPERPAAVILGADTLVCLDGEALGKPPNVTAALVMLSRLSGRTHQVYTGVCLACPAMDRVVSFVERTDVTFLSLGPARIRAYCSLINPLDKAGGYAAQEHGEKIIASTEGSWTNVLGLPMETLGRVLGENFGLLPGSSHSAPHKDELMAGGNLSGRDPSGSEPLSNQR